MKEDILLTEAVDSIMLAVEDSEQTEFVQLINSIIIEQAFVNPLFPSIVSVSLY